MEKKKLNRCVICGKYIDRSKTHGLIKGKLMCMACCDAKTMTHCCAKCGATKAPYPVWFRNIKEPEFWCAKCITEKYTSDWNGYVKDCSNHGPESVSDIPKPYKQEPLKKFCTKRWRRVSRQNCFSCRTNECARNITYFVVDGKGDIVYEHNSETKDMGLWKIPKKAKTSF